jgi:hypothetical protein
VKIIKVSLRMFFGRIGKEGSMEQWIEIQDFSGYSVSSLGHVRNDCTNRVLAINRNQSGVLSVQLRKDGIFYVRGVGRLVAEHFVPPHENPRFNTPIHRDGDRSNCEAVNLAWRPRSYAIRYHQEFSNDRLVYSTDKILNKDTGLIFESCREAGIYFGLRQYDVFASAHYGTPTWVTGHTFIWVE